MTKISEYVPADFFLLGKDLKQIIIAKKLTLF